MPSVPIRTALGASLTAFPLVGSRYEIAPFDCAIEIAVQADATGVLATLGSGTDAIQDEGPVQLATINVSPKYPDDFYLSDVVGQGERIVYQLRETSGAARVVLSVIKITPLG